jgi:transketolase
MPTLKPLDEEVIIRAASETGAIVVAEENILAQGGLGSRVAQVVAREKPILMEFVNLKDSYALSGKAEELLERYGLTARDIEKAVKSVVKRK